MVLTTVYELYHVLITLIKIHPTVEKNKNQVGTIH